MRRKLFLSISLSLLLTSCSYNPFSCNNNLTGSASGTAIGAGVGAGAAWLAGGSKTAILGTGIAGGAIGYYVTTLRFASGGVLQSCGQVFTLGDYATIEIPSDKLFETNSADFTEGSSVALDSAVAVLNRYPNNHILISGNTSGFGKASYEKKLSEDRARQVAAYLWAHGINNFQSSGMTLRKLVYVGYGNYFPIANNIRSTSIRQNSRIQITSYPTAYQLEIDRYHQSFNNIGALRDYPRKKPECVDQPPGANAKVLSDNPFNSDELRNAFKDD